MTSASELAVCCVAPLVSSADLSCLRASRAAVLPWSSASTAMYLPRAVAVSFLARAASPSLSSLATLELSTTGTDGLEGVGPGGVLEAALVGWGAGVGTFGLAPAAWARLRASFA